MKFKTTIQIIMEAKDKNEAMEIAGEYLCGNLTTGVDMSLRARPIRLTTKGIIIALTIVFIVGVLVTIPALKFSQNLTQYIPGNCAIQPPLKTSPVDKKYSDFKKEWQTRHLKESMDSIKK